MSAMNSTHFISMRDQVVILFKELTDKLYKFLTLLIALVSAMNCDTRKCLFMTQHKLMMCLVLAIVGYCFLVIIGTILEIYNRSLIPIINCAMLIFGGATSVLALSIISPTIAIITLVFWVGMLILVGYKYYVVHQRRSGSLPI